MSGWIKTPSVNCDAFHARSCIKNPRAANVLVLDTGFSAYARERRERDLNPRMAVLQTAALDHLAIPPYGLRTATYPTHVTLSSVNFLPDKICGLQN